MNTDKKIVIDYSRCARALLKNIGVILLVTVLCVFIGATAVYYTMEHDDVYEARSSVISKSGYIYEETLDVVQYADIAKSLKVAQRASLMLNDPRLDAGSIYDMIEIQYDDSPYTTVASAIINIHIMSANPDDTVKVANAVAKAFVIEALAITNSNRFDVLDTALVSAKIYVAENEMIKTTALIGLIGLLLICAIIVLREILSLRLTNVSDGSLHDELVIIGVVPLFGQSEASAKYKAAQPE